MIPPAFTNLTDLAAERFGGQTLACSDDFFAEVENLIKPGRGIFIEDKYTDRGKWICATAMLLGRLEFTAVFVLMTRRFWRG